MRRLSDCAPPAPVPRKNQREARSGNMGWSFSARRRPAAFAQAEARCPGNYARRLCSEKDVRSALDCANTSSDTTLWVLEIPRRHPGPARHPEQAGLSTRRASSLSLSLSPSLTLEASTARSCPWNERRFLFGEAGVKKDIMLSTKGWTPSLVAIRGGLHPRKNVK